eukprot:m.44028 g.44028  ORF g.44028 m.44028 type:complete len:358 (+) comp14504_c0_seq3:282-1355(+)
MGSCFSREPVKGVAVVSVPETAMSSRAASAAASSASGRRSNEQVVFADDKAPEDPLEHISEREDFSAHEQKLKQNMLPSSSKASPNFRRSTASPARSRTSSPEKDCEPRVEARMRKSNSTSTLFLDSTVSQPDLEETLRCVAMALRVIIDDGHEQPEPSLFKEYFDEARHPLTEHPVPRDYGTRLPDEDEISTFLKRLFHSAVLSAECGIITLVYINRAIAYTGLTLQAGNWKRVLLGAVLMASKVWDDQAVWNVDFCTIFPKIKVEDMNDLERTYLEMLQFNINVDSSVYAKYYFELRSLAETHNKTFSLPPLDKESAERLEAMSEKQEENFRKQALIRKAKSLDAKTFSTKAVIN